MHRILVVDDDCITEPFTIEVLVPRARTALRHRQSDQADVLRFHDRTVLPTTAASSSCRAKEAWPAPRRGFRNRSASHQLMFRERNYFRMQ